jgi:hypothetical protein
MSRGERWSRRGLLRKGLLLERSRGEEVRPFPESPPESSPGAEPAEAPASAPAPVEPASPEEIGRRIEAEPACRNLLLRLLEFCADPRAESTIYCWMRPFPELRTTFHAPETLFLRMVEAGAVTYLPGEGQWQTTPAGKQLLLSWRDTAGNRNKKPGI